MGNGLCLDPRCLFASDEKPQNPEFECMTRETREGAGLWERCRTCGLAINRTGVPPGEVGEYYSEAYVRSNSFTSGELLNASQHFEERLDSIRVIADSLRPYLTKSMRVLEVGSGTGELLYLLKDSVRYCFGIEINEVYAAFTNQELGIDSSCQDYLALAFEEPFDCVISINTLDHLYEPQWTVEKVRKELRPGGLFYVEVPNDDQALKRFLPAPQRDAFSKFMYQRAHNYSFSFGTVTRLLTERGFQVVSQKSRHDYTLNNYLHWYYSGQPQKRLRTAMGDTAIHGGETEFEREMNRLFADFNTEFKTVMERCQVGESICVLAQRPSGPIR